MGRFDIKIEDQDQLTYRDLLKMALDEDYKLNSSYYKELYIFLQINVEVTITLGFVSFSLCPWQEF